jgi:hypothetical protein
LNVDFFFGFGFGLPVSSSELECAPPELDTVPGGTSSAVDVPVLVSEGSLVVDSPVVDVPVVPVPVDDG